MADRRTAWRALCVVTVLLAIWGIRHVVTGAAHAGPPRLEAAAAGPAHAAPPLPGMSRSVPRSIRIRSINLDAPVDQLGLAPNGQVETPPYATANRAAWYKLGPAPGEDGPAVIFGHVDSKTGLAVFFYLTRVKPGDRVEVTRYDGRTAVFTVDSVEQFAKSSFPTARVYGPVAGAALRLVTCGGAYDRRHATYIANIVLFAHLSGTV